jgi:hypothetical protein
VLIQICISGAIFSKKKIDSGKHSDTKFCRRGGGVLVIPMPGKKVPERHSSLRPSEVKFLEWRSGTFCHKSTTAYIQL